MSNKVCLISLPAGWLISDRDIPFLGVLTLAAILRESGLDTQMVDLAGKSEDQWVFPEADIYGIGLVSPQFTVARKVVKLLKEHHPNARIVLGGVHPTALPEDTLQRLDVDQVVTGEADDIIVPVMRGELSEAIVQSPLPQNLDRLPFPAVDLIDIDDYTCTKTNKYVSDGKLTKEFYVQTGRGCPELCKFCAQRSMTRGRIRFFSLDYVERLVKHYTSTYDCHQFYFFDDTFIINKKRVYDFCKRAKSWNILWHCLARSDNFDYNIYREMYESGCRCITFGIESGSDYILTVIDKRTSVANHIAAMEAAKRAGLKVRAQVIVGLPGESDSTVEDTAKLIRNSPADAWGVHLFIPLPGSELFNHADKYGIPIDRDPDFESCMTIGKPGQKAGLKFAQDPKKLDEWHEYLLATVKDKDIGRMIGG